MGDTSAYEHNLKLYFDSKRKDLDILLSTTIPTQKNLMKTILWLNSSILAITITLLIKKEIPVIFLSLPFIFSSIAIFHILLSLKDGREKTFGTLPLSEIDKIPQDENEKVQGLYDMNTSLDIAFEANSLVVKKRGAKIGKAINFTMLSAISIFFMIIIYVNFYLMKGG